MTFQTNFKPSRTKRKICARCGTPFTPKSRGRILAKKYCSQQCQRLALHERSIVKAAARLKPCPKCGTPFSPRWTGRSWKAYCSPACYQAKRDERAEMRCEQCGVLTRKKKAQARRVHHHFCSEDCRRKWNVGANHPQFRGGTDYRHGSWVRRAKEARERDHHTCRRCGKVRQQGERAYPVDHVYPRRLFADKAQADDLVNLVTVCHGCHNAKTQGAEAAWLRGDVAAFDRYKAAVLTEAQRATLRAFVHEAGIFELHC